MPIMYSATHQTTRACADRGRASLLSHFGLKNVEQLLGLSRRGTYVQRSVVSFLFHCQSLPGTC